MSQVQTMWSTLSPLPLGARLFSFAFSRKAPYFATVRPRFTRVGPHRVELVVPKRRSVHNHLGTVHAIALCNGLEAAMGALAEVTIRADQRWIPKGMEVAYTAKATSDVTCVAETDAADWSEAALPASGGEVAVRVSGTRDDGTTVIEGVIRLWVTPRSRAQAPGGSRAASEPVR